MIPPWNDDAGHGDAVFGGYPAGFFLSWFYHCYVPALIFGLGMFTLYIFMLEGCNMFLIMLKLRVRTFPEMSQET